MSKFSLEIMLICLGAQLEDLGLNEDSWENAMYAMFGYLSFNNLYNFVPSCTGASHPVVGGRCAPGKNFASISLLNEED